MPAISSSRWRPSCSPRRLVSKSRMGGLTDDERVEYNELGAAARNDDVVEIGISTLLLPLLIGALVAAQQQAQLRVLLAAGSLGIWLYWFTVNRRRTWFAAVRFARASELEEKARLDHHRRIARLDDARRFRWGVKEAETVVSMILFGGWAYLLDWPWRLACLLLTASVLALHLHSKRAEASAAGRGQSEAFAGRLELTGRPCGDPPRR